MYIIILFNYKCTITVILLIRQVTSCVCVHTASVCIEHRQSDDVVTPDRLYDLVAVVVHCGSGPNRGHYISIVKSHGFWLLFDDDVVDVSDAAPIGRRDGRRAEGRYWLRGRVMRIDLGDIGVVPSFCVGYWEILVIGVIADANLTSALQRTDGGL